MDMQQNVANETNTQENQILDTFTFLNQLKLANLPMQFKNTAYNHLLAIEQASQKEYFSTLIIYALLGDKDELEIKAETIEKITKEIHENKLALNIDFIEVEGCEHKGMKLNVIRQ